MTNRTGAPRVAVSGSLATSSPSGEQVSTVIDAFSKEDALTEFHVNFWRIAFGDRSGKVPIGVDPHDLYEIIEVRPATNRDRRSNLD